MRKETGQEKYIAFDSSLYDSQEDMFNDISSLLKVLTKNGYQCAFRYEDCGIYVLEFDSDNPEHGTPMIYWLDSEQADCLYGVIGDEGDAEEQA